MKTYEYRGWLKPYLPEILDMYRRGMTPLSVWECLVEQYGVRNAHGTESMRLVRYIGVRYGVYRSRQWE